jgi:antitoxin component YwqK of YwqJK toxin-antitoxin module
MCRFDSMFRTVCIAIMLSGGLALQGQNQLDGEGRKTGHWKVEYPNGNTRYVAEFFEGRPVGEMLRYYENGALQARMLFDQDGNRSYAYLYYPNRKAAAEGMYVDQQKDSIWTYYSEFDGSVRIRESYTEGSQHGTSQSYYPSGEVSEEVDWKQGVKDGAWTQYYKNGVKRLSGYYEKGMLQGSYEVYYSNGKLEISGSYLDNKSHGIWRFYDESGKEVYALEYVHGFPADIDKYDRWIQDSLIKKYEAATEAEFIQ